MTKQTAMMDGRTSFIFESIFKATLFFVGVDRVGWKQSL